MLILKIFKFTRIDFKAFCFEFESFMISNYKKKLKDEKKKKKKVNFHCSMSEQCPPCLPCCEETTGKERPCLGKQFNEFLKITHQLFQFFIPFFPHPYN